MTGRPTDRGQSRARRAIRLAVILFALFSLTGSALAATSLNDAPVLHKARYLHSQRHGLTPSLGTSINHPYRQMVRLGVRYDYYLANWVGLGVDLGYSLGLDTSLMSEVVGKRTDFESTSFGFDAMVGFTLVPLYGKMSWLGSPSTRYDVFVRFSGGVVQLKGDGPLLPTELGFAPSISTGVHLFMGTQMAITLELKDTIISMYTGSSADAGVPARSLENMISFQLGILFHFPKSIEIGP